LPGQSIGKERENGQKIWRLTGKRLIFADETIPFPKVNVVLLEDFMNDIL